MTRPPEGPGLLSFHVDTLAGSDARAEIASTVVGRGWDLLTIRSIGMTLEEIFLNLTMSEDLETA